MPYSRHGSHTAVSVPGLLQAVSLHFFSVLLVSVTFDNTEIGDFPVTELLWKKMDL